MKAASREGILARAGGLAFRDRYALPPLDEYVAAMRDGLALAHARGVTAIHDKDGWIGGCRCSSVCATRAR